MAEQRMAALEEMANDAMKTVTPAMLMNCVNRVEKYYPKVMRQKDLR